MMLSPHAPACQPYRVRAVGPRLMDRGRSWTRCFRPGTVLYARRSPPLTGATSRPRPCETATGGSGKMSQAEAAARPAMALQPVEAVEITILMDNSLDVLAGDMPVARRARLPKDALSRPALRAEHGLSFLVNVVDGGRRDTLLFDTGVSPDGVPHNLDVLGLDLSAVRTIVLS